MATIPAHENEFPSLLFVEAAAPATPGTGLIIAYAKAGGVFAWKDDAGVEHIVGEGDTAAHLADTTDAHDASAISFTPAGTIAATDVQAAIEEVASEAGGGSFVATDSDRIIRTNVSNVTIASTTWADVDGTNITIDLTTQARRVMLMWSGRISNSSTGLTRWGFTVDGTPVVAEAAGSNGIMVSRSDANGVSVGFTVVYLTDVLTAATHTFRPRWNVSSGTTTLQISATSDFAVFSAYEVA